MARLWKKFDGEPFMINPRLGILAALNPRKRKRGKKMARRGWGAAHMKWVRSFAKKGRKNRRRRYKARRNPFPVAGLVANRRRRHKRHHYRANPRRHRRYRRNPGMAAVMSRFSLPPLTQVLYVGAGYVGVPMIEGYVNSSNFAPTSLTSTTIGKYGLRIAYVVGLTWLAKSVLGRTEAVYVGIGGGTYVALSALKEFGPTSVTQYLPTLGAYTRPSMGAYVRGTGGALSGLRGPLISSGTVGVQQARFGRFQ